MLKISYIVDDKNIFQKLMSQNDMIQKIITAGILTFIIPSDVDTEIESYLTRVCIDFNWKNQIINSHPYALIE